MGYGSGGDVHAPYEVTLYEGLARDGIAYNEELKDLYASWASQKNNQADHGYWGHWPFYYDEMPLTDEIVAQAKAKSDVALVIIGRAAGEDRENKLEEGSYYLTDVEKDMLDKVTKQFDHCVLLMDCGNIIDMSFVDDYAIDAIVYAWQLGQENANALAEVLSGKCNPSGKLSDTIAMTYEDYPSAADFGGKEFNNYTEDIYVGYRYFTTFAPDRIRYPFGYGLSYTTFSIALMEAARDEAQRQTCFVCDVTNTGAVPGKEVVQIYVSSPQGQLGKPARVLAGYQKTGLIAPSAKERVEIVVRDQDIASFDDSGVTGYANAFVLEVGTYRFYVGNDCMTEQEVYSMELESCEQILQCQEALTPASDALFDVLAPEGRHKMTAGTRDLRQRVLTQLPQEISPTGDRGIRLDDVKAGKHTLEEFIAQLSDKELSDLSHGEGMMGSALGMDGNAGAFGGITQKLRDKGIPALITADGPAGLRIQRYTTLLPCGTAIACAWNPKLTEETFVLVGQEAKHFGIDVNLAPGMNIHRNPLCGRNFEYYSEDPMLSGRTAAATVRGLQAGGTSACPKHFACNNQEYNRNYNDSRVSMRALREIYLKNFEYCVKEGHPQNLMTSYNKINGVWSHYNYDLVTTVLREEWGYEGNVMTDWWMRKDCMPEFPAIRNNAYRTRAQVDVLMPGNLSHIKKKYTFDK